MSKPPRYLVICVASVVALALVAGWFLVSPAKRVLRNFVAFSPDGRFLASGNSNGKVRLWQTKDWRRIRSFNASGEWDVTAIAFSPDSSLLCVGSGRYIPPQLVGLVTIWDLSSFTPRHELTGFDAEVTSAAFSPDGTRLVAGNLRSLICWDMSGQKPDKVYEKHCPATFLAVTDKGLITAGGEGGSLDKQVAIRDLGDGKERGAITWTKSKLGVTGFGVSSDGKLLALGGWRCLSVWSLETNKEVNSWETDEDNWPIRTIVFSKDDQQAIASGYLYTPPGVAKTWNVNSSQGANIRFDSPSIILSLAMSPDGATVAAGCADDYVRLFEVSSGTLITSIK